MGKTRAAQSAVALPVMDDAAGSIAPRHKTEMRGAAADDVAAENKASIEIHIPSSTEYVRVVRLAVTGVASRMPFSYDDVEDIKLAVSEACNNAILHAANASNTPAANDQAHPDASVAPPTVGIVLTPWADRLEITVADEGRVPPPGIAPQASNALPASQSAVEELQEGGMGLFLMQALMDHVEHHTGAESNTLVRLVKYVPGSPLARASASRAAASDASTSHEAASHAPARHSQ